MRLRLRFSKVGKVRFTGHRDVARIVERSLRRVALPLAMTEGFSPRPRLHFGLALSTGYESRAEFLDLDLRPDRADEVDVAGLPDQLSELLPPGLTVDAAAVVDRTEPSLQQAVTSCSWRLEMVDVDTAAIEDAVDRLLDRPSVSVTRTRKGQQVHDDLRPAIVRLAVVDGHLETELSTQPRGVRPAELLAAFEPPQPDPITEGGRVWRTYQWMTTADGAKREPLHATSASHAEVRAS